MAEARRRNALTMLLALMILVLMGSFGIWRYVVGLMDSPGPLQNEVVIQIPQGEGFSGITRILDDAGALENPLAFRIMARLSARDRNLKAGEYALEPGWSPNQILDALEAGDSILHRVTVPEGLTVAEVADIVARSEILSGSLPEPLPAEGTLLPETYLVARDEPRRRVMARMEEAMTAVLDEVWSKRAADLPFETPEEALTLASIIEKETSVPDEYELVSGVFVNRLREGMRLQTDPTVIYALTEGSGSLGRRLTRDDLRVEHEYNTYVIAGLPPGPIANPGRAALEAAVNPAATDYLFFVADGTGGHAFALSLDEHNRNVRNWRRVRAAAEARPPVPRPRPAEISP